LAGGKQPKWPGNNPVHDGRGNLQGRFHNVLCLSAAKGMGIKMNRPKFHLVVIATAIILFCIGFMAYTQFIVHRQSLSFIRSHKETAVKFPGPKIDQKNAGNLLMPNNAIKEQLYAGGFVLPKSEIVTSVYLYNNINDIQPMLKLTGLTNEIINSVNFNTNSVAIVVHPWRVFDIKSVSVVNKEATIIEFDYPDSPTTSLDTLVGMAGYRFVILKIPKVIKTKVIVQIKHGTT
jgi:hypothetical protein